MVKVYDAKQSRPYSLKSDTDEPQTVFFIGGLIPRLHSHLSNGILDTEKHRVLSGSVVRETVRFGLKGWENFQGLDGNLIAFDEKLHTQSHGTPIGPFKGLTDQALDLIPWVAQQELFNAITESNTLSGEDLKNSDTPSV
jgi:hypothetical protein